VNKRTALNVKYCNLYFLSQYSVCVVLWKPVVVQLLHRMCARHNSANNPKGCSLMIGHGLISKKGAAGDFTSFSKILGSCRANKTVLYVSYLRVGFRPMPERSQGQAFRFVLVPACNVCCCYYGVGIETGYGLDDLGSIPGSGNIFLFSTASRPTLGLNQSPIQWVPGGEADHSPPSSAEVKKGGAIPPRSHTSSWCNA
jgi:hypothetical protein